MAGINDIFAIGKRALIAQQVGMQVVSNNISNAQNPNYSRQDVKFANDLYLKHANFYVGSGVTIDDVSRIRDQFYDIKYWQENSDMSKWDSELKYGQLVENTFTDLSGSGISEQLDVFWNNWMDLGNHPQDVGQRTGLVSATNQLINTFHNVDSQLRSIATQANDELEFSINEVNRLITNISDLNKQIAGGATGSGANNTLLDQRDALISELSNYLDVDATYHQDGTVSLTSNYKVIVDQTKAFHFRIESENINGAPVTSIYAYGKEKYDFKSGKLKSLVGTVNSGIPDYIEKLDAIANAFVTKVNAIHNKNYNVDGNTNVDFFEPSGTTIGSIQLSQDVKNSVWNIAISKDGNAGDGNGALDIADVRSSLLMQNGTATLNSAFGTIINQIGNEGRNAEQNLQNQSAVVNMIDNQRQAIMGVSIDEEMVNLMKFQTAFGAASRIITTVDEMTQTILNMV